MANIQRRDLMKEILATTIAVAFPLNLRADQNTEEAMMDIFRQVAKQATQLNYVGGFPTFCIQPKQKGLKGWTVSTILLGSDLVDWKDVALIELGSPSLDDFGGRMRSAQAYATRHGYVAGFPNFFDAPSGPNGHQRVCGTILIKNQPGLPGTNQREPNGPSIVVRDVSLAELGNVHLTDSLGRFRATQKFADSNGFAGGFPNMNHVNFAGTINQEKFSCGTVLFSTNKVGTDGTNNKEGFKTCVNVDTLLRGC